ncbi:MAG: MarR family transcriptional regulator [Butyricicoccus pullicaecorum]|jgi:DNA-binding MarR family transcriptional regulator|nr:MarR family transcriptional regulator [Butyricicoccus pullicaecorum]
MDIHESVGLTIRTLSNLLRRKFACPTQSHDSHCSEASGIIMCYLCEHSENPLYQHDVEQAFRIRRSTASRVLTLLEEDGLIERHSDSHDARKKRIVPTQKALSIHKQLLQRREALEACIKQGISQEELRVFFEVARKIEANLSQESDFPI